MKGCKTPMYLSKLMKDKVINEYPAVKCGAWISTEFTAQFASPFISPTNTSMNTGRPITATSRSVTD